MIWLLQLDLHADYARVLQYLLLKAEMVAEEVKDDEEEEKIHLKPRQRNRSATEDTEDKKENPLKRVEYVPVTVNEVSQSSCVLVKAAGSLRCTLCRCGKKKSVSDIGLLASLRSNCTTRFFVLCFFRSAGKTSNSDSRYYAQVLQLGLHGVS